MRIVLTGSSGRVGRAIFAALAQRHDAVVGLDRSPCSTTHVVGDIADKDLLATLLTGADAVIHTAALHAPHVGLWSDEEFHRVNVLGTRLIAEAALAAGVRRLVFTSTTALYGHAVRPGFCAWIDEETEPRPKSIYHRTKRAAEDDLEGVAGADLDVRVLRMSRCFPEAADVMAVYRLHRGVDVRDVADAHIAALSNGGPAFQRYIVSGASPFASADCETLASDAGRVIAARAPALVAAYRRRGWSLPEAIDRVYCPDRAATGLGWSPRFGFAEVLAQLDRRSLEVLPPGARISRKSE